MRFWNFKEPDNADEPIELRIDGTITDDDDVWLYELFGIPCGAPNKFRQQLDSFSGQGVDVWIDSYGGSVTAAMGIYNALMSYKNKNKCKVRCIGDGKVVSAATIPFMAGDEREMMPGTLMMIHNPLTSADGYAEDLRKTADVLDTVKNGILNTYHLATGISKDELSTLMNEETYMDAATAVKKGFATKVCAGKDGADVTDVINFCREPILNVANSARIEFIKALKNMEGQKEKTEEKMEIKTVQDLQKAYPDLCNQLTQLATDNEQKRMTALDALDVATNPAVHAIVENARHTGQTSNDIKFVVNTIIENAPKVAPVVPEADNDGAAKMAKMVKDAMTSGASGVVAQPASITAESTAAQDAKDMQSMVASINRMNGRVK